MREVSAWVPIVQWGPCQYIIGRAGPDPDRHKLQPGLAGAGVRCRSQISRSQRLRSDTSRVSHRSQDQVEIKITLGDVIRKMSSDTKIPALFSLTLFYPSAGSKSSKLAHLFYSEI